MSVTLTDRTSVRVTAKDSTETSNQNKTNGGNVATALGGTGLTDNEKESLGASLGDTVTDENGKTYARSDKIAGVLKQLSQDGKLSESEEVHEGITAGGVTYNLPAGFYTQGFRDEPNADYSLDESSSGIYKIRLTNQSWFYIVKPDDVGSISYVKHYGPNTGNAVNDGENGTLNIAHLTANGTWYYPNRPDGYGKNGIQMNTTFSAYPGDSIMSIGGTSYPMYKLDSNKIGDSGPYMDSESFNVIKNRPQWGKSNYFEKCVAGFLYGNVTEQGGAPLDPTGKTDDQIKRELEAAAAQHNAVIQPIGSNETYIAVTDENGNPMYFLGT